MRGGRPEQQDQFVREAQVTGQLEHPGIVPIHELGHDETGQPYYVMKFVHGQTLKDVTDDYHGPKQSPAEPKEVRRPQLLNSFVSLCQTIAYAHSREVIHRDIKPDNVMVGPYGETLVLDWGLAKVVGEPDALEKSPGVRLSYSGESLETLDGTVKGTPTYMAPEMAEGKVEAIDESSDIYLLGATLYHMLTGKAPRTAKKLSELLTLARTQEPTPPRQLDATVPKPLDAICRKAMAFQKADRYATALALAEDVQRYLAGEPVEAYRENVWERAGRWVRRHRTALMRAAAVVVVLTVGSVAALAVRDSEQRRAEAQRVADDLRRQEQARTQVAEFRRLAEETRFFAANADPAEENAPFFDLKKGEARGAAALAVAESWGPKLEQLPLADDVRDALKQEQYDLLLLLAQVKNRRGEAKEALALLDRAAGLAPPTRGLHRLRGESYRLLDDAGRAAAGQRLAQDAKTPTRALDHFLAGEGHRAEAAQLSLDAKDGQGKSEKHGLLEQAAGEYRHELRLDPEHYWSHFQLGRTYQSLGKNAEAVEVLGACVALRPNAPWGYSARGLALTGLKRFAEATADLERGRRSSTRTSARPA